MKGPDPLERRERAERLLRGRLRLGTRLGEAALFVVSLTVLLMLALIVLFVAREALPVALGKVDAALLREVMPVEEALALRAPELQEYLDLTPAEFERLDSTALRELAELRMERRDRIPEHIRGDPDAAVNPIEWRYLLRPHSWTGYPRPVYVWQPISPIRKYNLVPLVVGSLKVTVVAVLVAFPLSVAAAIYVNQLAPRPLRAWIRSAIQLLAGIPSVVIGFLALVLLAGILDGPTHALAGALGWPASRLNAGVAGLALGFAVIPVVFSVAEDALASVPRTHAIAALGLGATPWQATWQVVLPAASPGLLAAGILGFSRAMSDTMIVLMASGNAALMSWNIFEPARAMTATIAAEMAEALFGGHHYRMLFLIGTLLLGITFVCNLLAEVIIRRFKTRLGRSA
jgi:phosphate transport system permease protein